MKKRLLCTVVGLVLMFGITACGEEAMVVENDMLIVESPKNETTSKQESEASKVALSEQENSEETKEEEQWIPEQFEMDDVVNIDYIAPAVHTGANEQCTFLWDYTEDDLKTWFMEKYEHYNGRVTEYAFNVQALESSKDRNYSIKKEDDATNEEVKLTVSTGKYNSSVVHAVEFNIISPTQAVVVEEACAMIELMGFGAYAEDIIHSDVPWINIPTENEKGNYDIMSTYYVSEQRQNYSLTIRISFEDSLYKHSEFFGHDSVNFEYWDTYFTLSDYLANCEFDTSSIDAFEEEERNFLLENFDSAYVNVDTSYKFSYYRYDFGEIENVNFEYIMMRNNARGETNGTLMIEHEWNDDEVLFNVSANGRQPFENREDKRWISDGDDLTDAEIKELCEVRYDFMKKLDNSIDWTVEDLMKQYRSAEFKEENDKKYFYGNGYEYYIKNDLYGLDLIGKFKLTTE